MKEAPRYYFHSFTISSLQMIPLHYEQQRKYRIFSQEKSGCHIFFCILQILCALYRIHHIALEYLVCMSCPAKHLNEIS